MGQRPDLPGAVHPPFPGRPDRPRDTCFASYLGWRLKAPAEAVRVAGAVTTLSRNIRDLERHTGRCGAHHVLTKGDLR